jgi:flagellar protein FliO/FliZ
MVLGTGQKVITVELNAGGERTWLVLGVTPQQITTLHTLPAPDAGAAFAGDPTASNTSPSVASGFAQHLRSLTERRANAA